MKREEGGVGKFVVEAQDGLARTGVLQTKSGFFETPAFMPVGTQATVKAVTPRELEELGAQIVLTNTYHLHLRPGDQLIKELGGIHSFMGWKGPILSDSGGFQVYSLSKLRRVTDDGITFQSHVDGKSVVFTPEKVVEIQENLDVDIMMVLDECLAAKAEEGAAAKSWLRTLSWAKRSLQARRNNNVLMFGIVQGGMYPHLREKAAADLTELDFDGYAIGGLSVGEPVDVMRRLTGLVTGVLPTDKVRYLMGVGTPLDLVESVRAGVDMFDCVIPTRSARFGRVFTGNGWFNIRNEKYRTDTAPLEEGCDCYACRNFTRAYISHLMHAKEILAMQLATFHNLRFYQRLMSTIRQHIKEGTFSSFADLFAERWQESVSAIPNEEEALLNE